MQSEENSEGLLRWTREDYTKFWTLDVEGFTKLLDSDVLHNEKELSMRQEESRRIAESTASFLAQQQKMLEDFVMQQQQQLEKVKAGGNATIPPVMQDAQMPLP